MDSKEASDNKNLGARTRREQEAETLVSNLDFKRFDPKELLEEPSYLCCTALIAACKRSGKTVILKDLMSHLYKYYDDCYLMSESVWLQPKEYDFVEEYRKIDHFDENLLSQIYERQVRHVQQIEAEGLDKYKVGKKIMIILDDFISDPKVLKSKVFRTIFTNGRHCLISIWCLSQTVNGIPLMTRRNLDLVIIFFLENYRDREAISEQFLSIGDSRTIVGDRIQRSITSVPYQAVVLREFKKTQDYEELVGTYTATTKPKKFKFKTLDYVGKSKNKRGTEVDIRLKNRINY